MKLIKTLVCALIAGTVAFAASKASAFPLYLTSLNGTITYTAEFGNSASNTTQTAKTVTANLKTIMTVVTNQVALNVGSNVPPNTRIAFDPVIFRTYLTNNDGFFYDLSANNVVNFYINEIATTFRAAARNGGVENDTLAVGVTVVGTAPDGLHYEFDLFGRGRLAYNVNGVANKANMTISGSGSDYGAYKDSSDGVATGSFVLRGAGTPEFEGPYSIFWWND